MKYYKYKAKDYNQLIDLQSKISDIVFKIFTVLFVGVLGLTVSIYNLKLNNEKKIYELLTTTTKQFEENRELSVERYLEPMLFAQKISGVPFSRSRFLDYLSSHDPYYKQINENFQATTDQFKVQISQKFENINLISWISIALIILFFLIYLGIQINILRKLLNYKKDITTQWSP
ncbi:MAG: hypothetical protein RBR23_07705 [Arcobacteraceae bacterium]|jgi:hypothetical protein|nr:hypothetical protein [Arcobacteraceae bacterium]